MPRPPLPLGSYGKISSWQEGAGWTARATFRDFDGVSRLVKRTGRSKAAAERALRATLPERQAPGKGPAPAAVGRGEAFPGSEIAHFPGPPLLRAASEAISPSTPPCRICSLNSSR